MNGKILVGTASWSDRGFIQDWPPKTVNHVYTEEELQEAAKRAEVLASETAETHVVYNNNVSDDAIKAAARFQDITGAWQPA